ncbi:THO complex subunit 4B-like [Impatiens glandulifera]|uniref:THO complex subunit 4B-like n=1 Tax=Impatiens glandulifera TaxID=253017 RepID=UPI001FB1583B|nr:THO complex subunit 4B-like [Impatiens glandulifera]
MSGAAAMDMTLDDLIKVNKKSSGASRGGRTRPSGPGPVRRFSNRGGSRPAPYATSQVTAHPAQAGARPTSIETGTKLYISNLDYGVSNEDIKELFSEVGDIKRYGIHYDRSGRSKGTAEVVFSKRQEAVAAVKRYNNVQLDGKPMKTEIVGTNIATPAIAPIASGPLGNYNGVPRSGRGRGGGAPARNRGGRNFGRGGRGGAGKSRGEKPSAEDLDKDLDLYYAKATDAGADTMEAN